MNRYCLPLLGLLTALFLSGCAASAARPAPPPETVPVHTAPASEFIPLPEVENSAAVPGLSTPVLAVSSPAPEEGNYFDNTLFVGDSIMEGIRQYVAAQRQEGEMLGTARFLTTTMGMSLADLVGDREVGVQFSYQGEESPLQDIVAEIAPRRVFLLLGLNDLASDTDPVIADVVDRYIRLIDTLQMACPGIECVIITNPPKVSSRWLPDYTANRHFSNELIEDFVDALTQMCRDNNIPCVDAYEYLKNENGALPDDYCRDGYIHLNHQGAAVVVEALEAFAEGR